MFEIFVYGTFWFWTLIALEITLLFICTVNERFGFALFSVIFGLALLHCFGNLNIFETLANHPLIIFGCFIGYFIVGTSWAICKWWFHVRDMRRKYAEVDRKLKEMRKAYDKAGITEEFQAWCQKTYKIYPWYEIRDYKPNVYRSKTRILFWMSWWPFSLAWTLINDPITRAFTCIYNAITNWLQRISDSAFAEFEKPLK
jgi:hypothetical protein